MMLTVPMLPPSLNVMLRMHWAVRKRLKSEWELALLACCSAIKREAIRAMAKSGARVLVNIKIFHKKPYDPDNLFGSVKDPIDAMRAVGFLTNDRPQDIELRVSQVIQIGDPYTEITLEEI